MLPDTPDAVVRYADHFDGVMDLHLPPGAPESTSTRLVFLLHGGFWKVAYDRRHTRRLARALADRGSLVATPEYRRVGAGSERHPEDRGGWPITGHDVLQAATRLPGLIAGLGLAVPPACTVAGHSAGGQLALWLLGQPNAVEGLGVDRTVGLAPVCDLREAIRLELGGDATRAFLKDEDPDDADPMVLLDPAPDAEVVLVHATGDQDVPVALSRGFVAEHPWAHVREVPGDHFAPIEPSGPAWEVVRPALLGLPLPPQEGQGQDASVG